MSGESVYDHDPDDEPLMFFFPVTEREAREKFDLLNEIEDVSVLTVTERRIRDAIADVLGIIVLGFEYDEIINNLTMKHLVEIHRLLDVFKEEYDESSDKAVFFPLVQKIILRGIRAILVRKRKISDDERENSEE